MSIAIELSLDLLMSNEKLDPDRVSDILSQLEWSIDEMRAESKRTLEAADRQANSFSPFVGKLQSSIIDIETHLERISKDNTSKKIPINTYREHTLLLEKIEASSSGAKDVLLSLRREVEQLPKKEEGGENTPSPNEPSLASGLKKVEDSLRELSERMDGFSSENKFSESPRKNDGQYLILSFLGGVFTAGLLLKVIF